MGYACPVCTDPQADATHLANHLAFTALARGGDHEEWLDEHVPEWESMNEETLGDQIVDLADDTDYPQVFEDTTDQGVGDHQHDHADGHDHQHGRGTQDISDAMLSEAESALADEDVGTPDEVMAEARELTRKRRERGGSEASTSEEGAVTEESREQRGSGRSDEPRNANGDDRNREQRGGSDEESESESE